VNSGTKTAAEATSGRARIRSSSLGIPNYEMLTPLAEGGAPATNIEGNVILPEWCPFAVETDDLANASIAAEFAAAVPEPTADVAVQIVAVYDDGNTPDDIWDAYPNIINDVHWHMAATDADIGDALTEEFAELFSGEEAVPGYIDEIVGCKIIIAPDAAPTGGEFLLFLISLTSSIGGIDPQEIPGVGIGASLGTPVGAGQIQNRVLVIALHIPKPRGSIATFTPTALLLAVVGGAQVVSIELMGRDSTKGTHKSPGARKRGRRRR